MLIRCPGQASCDLAHPVGTFDMTRLAVSKDLGSAFRTWNRKRKVAWLRRFCDEAGVRSVLLVGIAAEGGEYAWGNLVEDAVAEQCEFTVWSGFWRRTDRTFLLCDALRLPFPDDAFDLVFSNAVIEHVGQEDEQLAFVAEHARVGRSWVLTTPNLGFPVESHTNAVLSHWSPRWRRGREEFTRLLTRRQLRRLLPREAAIVGNGFSPTFIAYSTRPGSGGRQVHQELMDERGSHIPADAPALDDDREGQVVEEAGEPGVGLGRVLVAELGGSRLATDVATEDRRRGPGA
jgi:hypothetical protein